MGERSDWMSGHYGIMIHYLPPDIYDCNGNKIEDPQEAVNSFDVPAFMKQFDECGAEWLIFTIGQNTGFYSAPNDVIEKRAGSGHCAVRDLVMELADQVALRGKKLIAYLPTEVASNSSMKEPFGWVDEADAVQTEFWKRYLDVVRFWGERYGKKVAGWWFDGCYAPLPWQEWSDAAKCGNEERVIAFNDGCFLVDQLMPVWDKCDYFAGEGPRIAPDGTVYLGRGPQALQTYRNQGKYMPGTRVLAHILTNLDELWFFAPNPSLDWLNEWFPGHTYDTGASRTIRKPIYSDEQLRQLLHDFCGNGGAVTFNLGCYVNGQMSADSVAQLARLKSER